jgi:predicted 2-oxoglutarate/Fe(II)-dependent dioxygenase YbiX
LIVQVSETVSDRDCQQLITMYDRHAHLTNVRDYTGHPVVYWTHVQQASDANEVIPRLVSECVRRISGALQLAYPLHPETVVIAAMGSEGHHGRHADNCRQNEEGDWVPNHTPQRDISAIYYLNETFEGGEIAFDREGLTIKPRRGLLLAFPSGAAHVHEVLPVKNGVRYTMPIWLTKERAFALKELSLE